MTTLGDFELNQIYTGDARELARGIPDESVDLIFTDPVYDRIDDYRWLAETAARVLKQGGNLIAQSGTIYLNEIIEQMGRYGLRWQTIIAEVYPLASWRVMMSRTMQGWKPYIWFSNGPRLGKWVFDRFYGGGRDKRHHEWGDSEDVFIQYVDSLSESDSIIFDPFTGGGTVPAVCKMLGRNYLAFEIDPDTAERARERVRNTQPPLFVLQPEQVGMELDV